LHSSIEKIIKLKGALISMPYSFQGKKKIISFFIVMYIVFGAMLFYLIQMTPGLEFSQEQTGETAKVFVKNNSVHLIYNISVYGDDKKEVISVEKLAPQEKKEIPLGEGIEKIKLFASAPYHATVSQEFSIHTQKGINVAYKTSYPGVVFTGYSFTLKLNLCNNDKENINNISIEESHDSEFIKEENSAKEVSLEAGECMDVSYDFTPLKVGKTTANFNISAADYNEKFSREINIEE
jgi:uncharacterized membrane protein